MKHNSPYRICYVFQIFVLQFVHPCVSIILQKQEMIIVVW
jgi:hypothetical protein